MLVAVWIVVFALIVGIGLYAGTKVTKSSEWNGGDRSMGIFTVGSLFGAWQIGGMAIVGAAQNGYTMGIAGCWYSIASGLYILAIALLSTQLRNSIKTSALPDFLVSRYNTTLARVQSYIWIMFGMLYVPIQLKTISSVIQIVLPGLNAAMAMFIGVTIAAVYTGFAGMKGAAAIGRIVCVTTYVLLIIFVAMHIGEFGGYSGLVSQLPGGYDKLSAMPTQEILAWAIGGSLSSIVSQACLQPMLAAKDDRTAKWGCVLGYIIAAPICILTAIIGMMARVKTTDLGDGATAFAWTVRELSSPIFAGIIFAVSTIIIAATMATMMMSTGTILTNVYKNQINRDASDESCLRFARFGTIVVAYFSYIIGFVIPSASLNSMFLTLNYLVTAPFSFAVIVGMFWKSVNGTAALASVLAGFITAIAWVAFGLNSTLQVVYPTILVSYAVGITATLASKPNTEA